MTRLAFVVGWLAAAVAPAWGAPASVTSEVATHHILVLDDSGSMETDFDVHGFALAVPQIFERFVGQEHPDRLTVLLLAQGSPVGPVPRLSPADYLTYARENGTAYGRAVDEALRLARASSAARVEIALVTDAEPEDEDARAAVDRALAADARLRFSCFQLGTNDPGDLCAGHAQFARDGSDMARLLATQLAATMGSIPRWGRLAGPGSVPIPLGRFVRRVRLIALGERAGEDFAAELVDAKAGRATALTIDHTRPLMSAEALRQNTRRGPRAPAELPVGEAPRLAIGTLTAEVTAGSTPELRVTRADGAVAWAVMLEYDLDVGLEVPNSIAPGATSFTARAHLLHAGVHVDDAAALAALGLEPRLVVNGRELPMVVGSDGWSAVEVPAEVGVARWAVQARYTSATALLASAEQAVAREVGHEAGHEVGHEVAPSAPGTPQVITTWLPPTLDLPDWALERAASTYALTVRDDRGHTLTGAEIAAQQLTAALVVDGVEVPMALVGDRFEVTHALPEGPRTIEAALVLRYPTASGRGEVRSAAERVEVLPDARVRLPAALDVGAVDAGCEAEAVCRPVDLSGSRALERSALTASRSDALEDVTVTLRQGEARWVVGREPVALGTLGAAPLEVCWAPAGCTELPEHPEVVLAIAPSDARLADRGATMRIAAEVTPSRWLDCNLWWCLLIIGGIVTLIIAWGYVRPRAFPSGALVQVADQERRLARDPGRPLRSVPHGRRGFYRTATCAFDPSGFTVKRSRSHVVQLRADRGGIELLCRGAAVERRQRGQWVIVDPRDERFVLSGATYRVNQSFVFRVLA